MNSIPAFNTAQNFGFYGIPVFRFSDMMGVAAANAHLAGSCLTLPIPSHRRRDR